MPRSKELDIDRLVTLAGIGQSVVEMVRETGLLRKQKRAKRVKEEDAPAKKMKLTKKTRQVNGEDARDDD